MKHFWGKQGVSWVGAYVLSSFFLHELYAVMTSYRPFLKSHSERTAQTPVFADFIL